MEKENKVITKADERKALEQIKKIVESVGGEKSYIGTAFKGVFELAEENIEYDFGCSALDWKDWRDKNVQEIDERDERIDGLTKQLNEKRGYADELYKRFRKQEVRAIKAEETLAAKDVEIIKLKAKLYDLMVKE